MAETQTTSRETSETPSNQPVAEEALMNVRSEILKQISCALNSETEDGNFTKWYSHTKIPGGLESDI
jgi:hypothetical protein